MAWYGIVLIAVGCLILGAGIGCLAFIYYMSKGIRW